MDLENGKVQGNGHQGPLAAGEEADGPQGLARRLDPDVDAAGEDLLLVLQGQGPLTAPEEVGKGLGEGVPDAGELPEEDLPHLLRDALDDDLQLPLGGLHVGLLVV